MKKKLIIIGCFTVLACIILLFIKNYYVENNKKVRNENLINFVVLHISNDDRFESELIQDIKIDYDKEAEVYIATVVFKDNPKIMHLIINPDDIIDK